MKKLVLILLLLICVKGFTQTTDNLLVTAEVIAIDTITNIVLISQGDGSKDFYTLVLFELNANTKKRLVVRNMSRYNLKEGKTYKVEIEKLPPPQKFQPQAYFLHVDENNQYVLIKVYK